MTENEERIDTLLLEERRFPPPAEFTAQANAGDASVYADAAAAPEAYWASWAEQLHWYRKWDRVLDWDPPFAKWFVGGKLNAAYNCVDRHVDAGRGAKRALVWEGEPGDTKIYTYAELQREVSRAANALKTLGVQKGDRVAIGMRNYPEWITAFAAITSIGAISVSLNAWWTEDELDYALGDSAPKVLIADKERVERGLRSCQDRGIAVLGVRLGDTAPAGVDRLEDVVVPGATMPDVELSGDDDATILYTSGTTGNPK
ncbi:MAG: AMP-binding protein, partial [Gemmatimonadetes bacterium]|nr:AMP-binding protein [Gemmatimonadota bacterium]